MKEFYINDDGIRLHAKLDFPERKKTAPLLILLHGLTGHMEENHLVRIQQAVTKAGIAVLRVDLYGHGKSDGSFKDHTILKWITNLMTITDYAKAMPEVTELYLSGHSQGGLLAMIAAGIRPYDYQAVIPLSPGVSLPEDAREGSFLGISFDPDQIPDEITEDIPGLGTVTLSGNYFRCMQLIDMKELISRYRSPVLIIHGQEDEVIPPEVSMAAAMLYERGRISVFKEEVHDYDHQLGLVCEAITSFLLSREE
jgi:hypothetical protein